MAEAATCDCTTCEQIYLNLVNAVAANVAAHSGVFTANQASLLLEPDKMVVQQAERLALFVNTIVTQLRLRDRCGRPQAPAATGAPEFPEQSKPRDRAVVKALAALFQLTTIFATAIAEERQFESGIRAILAEDGSYTAENGQQVARSKDSGGRIVNIYVAPRGHT